MPGSSSIAGVNSRSWSPSGMRSRSCPSYQDHGSTRLAEAASAKSFEQRSPPPERAPAQSATEPGADIRSHLFEPEPHPRRRSTSPPGTEGPVDVGFSLAPERLRVGAPREGRATEKPSVTSLPLNEDSLLAAGAELHRRELATFGTHRLDDVIPAGLTLDGYLMIRDELNNEG